MHRTRRNGEAWELNLQVLARRSAAALGDCGTFPRGKVQLHWKSGQVLDLGAHQCNHRLCPRCARRRSLRLAGDMAGALGLIEGWGWGNDRTRFATLTIENVSDVNSGINRIMEAWHRTLATKTWGRLIAGGFRAVEMKPGKDGRWNVHLHAILFLWTPGVPYRLIRDAWDRAAGGHYNQRFDTLKNKAKPAPGESKTAAAARYLVKYLVKYEELKGTRRMPGGLAHLLGAMDGRRLFGAWGLGAAAIRIERHERPRWTRTYDQAVAGYQVEGLPPESAEIQLPWGQREQITIPMPALPAGFRREDVPEQLEPRNGKWTVRRIHVQNPLDLHPWRKLPSAAAKTADRMKRALDAWIENPRSRGPRPFRWRPWIADAAREWTPEAQAIMGERITTPYLGAALWSRIQKPDEGFPDPARSEHFARQMVAAYARGIATARRHMHDACTDQTRGAYLARLPGHIRGILEEECREAEACLWTVR